MTVSAVEESMAEKQTGITGDARYMRRALTLARQGRGYVSPNPMVGAVLVRGGEIVGEGYHQRYGGPHAEIVALEAAGDQAAGATAYVSLEPCVYHGKTPPCTDALIKAGVARVVAAMRDPNPAVNGRGLACLQEAGVQVSAGVLAAEAADLNRSFIKWISTGRPYVIVKVARTSDNFVAVSTRGKRWFTSASSWRRVQQLRAGVDAVMIGRRTAFEDNPALTVRDVPGVSPKRVVLDSRRTLPADRALFTDGAAPTWLFTACGTNQETPWGEQIVVGQTADGLDLREVLDVLGDKAVTALLVEGGPALHRRMMADRLVDEIVLFTSSKRAGPDVQGRDDLRNVVAIPENWRIVEERILMGNHLLVARPKIFSWRLHA